MKSGKTTLFHVPSDGQLEEKSYVTDDFAGSSQKVPISFGSN